MLNNDDDDVLLKQFQQTTRWTACMKQINAHNKKRNKKVSMEIELGGRMRDMLTRLVN